MNYERSALVRMIIRDFWNDGYRSHALRLYHNRHTVELDRYGWPRGF